MTFVFKHPSYYKKIKKLTTTVPPEKGPQSQGLNIQYNTVKDVTSEKNYGNRQKSTKQKG
jgi:hypothetical protein